MLRTELEPAVIPFLMAQADETAVAEPPAPSIQEAYAAEHAGVEEKPQKREDESRRNSTLAEERGTADSVAESERAVRRELPKKEPTLSEAYNGTNPDEDAEVILEQDGLPEVLQGFDADSIVATMVRLGLTDDDLEDPRWVNVLKEQLESEQGAKIDDESEEESSEDEDSGEEGEDEQDKEKPEEKPAEQPKTPAPVAQFAPAELQDYIQKTYEMSRDPSLNHPQLEKAFVASLANAIGGEPPATEEERVAKIGNVVQLLQYGAMATMQSAVPRLVHGYMQANFNAIVEAGIEQALESRLPGLKAMHQEAIIANTWSDVLAMEEFKDAGLPEWDDQEAFNKAAEAVHKANPWLANWDPGPNVPIREALRQKAILTARLLKGETYDPKKIQRQVSDAIETGRNNAVRSHRRVSASRALGHGKTTGVLGESKQERESLMSAYARGSGGGAI